MKFWQGTANDAVYQVYGESVHGKYVGEFFKFRVQRKIGRTDVECTGDKSNNEVDFVEFRGQGSKVSHWASACWL